MLRRLTALCMVIAALAAFSTVAQAARGHQVVPHYNGWMCIHHSEGAWYAVGRGDAAGHYNGLQMTWSWGYGIVGNPNNYTPRQILEAAERGLRANWSNRTGWLQQQWGSTIGPCWQHFRT